jgi:Tfp pilus assembly protein PilF
VNRGTAEFMRNHIDKARNDYQRALQLDPTALDPSSTAGTLVEDRSVTDPARFHFLLAKLYCSVGRLDDAMHQFRQALEQHYPHWKDVFKDDTFKPLRARRDFQLLMSQPTQS